jgi:pre-mRNA-processing factor 6
VKKARYILDNLIKTYPNNSAGWIGAVRVEEIDGKIQAARNIIAQACKQFPDKEDIWLEASRLAAPEMSKQVLAKAI